MVRQLSHLKPRTNAHYFCNLRCEKCKKFTRGFEKAATHFAGIVGFGAVDAEVAKLTADAAEVYAYPTIQVFLLPESENAARTTVTFRGSRKADKLVHFVNGLMPSEVILLTDDNAHWFNMNGTVPKALYFHEGRYTPPCACDSISASVQLQSPLPIQLSSRHQ